MSDTIQALNEVVFKCSEREEDCGENEKLLEQIVEIAGAAIEDHQSAKAGDRVSVRKERVYKEIVRRIAVNFCDVCDNPEQAQNIEADVRETLASFDITTVDFTGREVKIV